MNHSEPQVLLPPPIDGGPSPLWPQHLIDLFVRPRRFFTGQLALGRTPYAVFVAWCYGAAASIDRIDQNLLRAELGRPRRGWEEFAPYIVDSWPGFWLFLLVSGAAGGAMLWWIGGWWFALRARWSGVAAPDRRLARLIMVYSGLIHSAPALVAAAISALFFGSYVEAFEAEEAYSLVLLVFPFWSSFVGYTGVRAVFGVSGWRPRVWFLILPCLFYLSVMGLLALLLAMLLGGR